MRLNLRMVLLTTAAVCAFAVTAAASASAHEFHSSKEGAVKLTAESERTEQQFSFEGVGNFACPATVTAKVKAGYFGAMTETITYNSPGYRSCGRSVLGFPAMEFEFKAGGTARLLKDATIKEPITKCEITFPTTGNEALAASYWSTGTVVHEQLQAHLKGTATAGKGGGCGTPGPVSEEFSSNFVLEVEGGLLSWA